MKSVLRTKKNGARKRSVMQSVRLAPNERAALRARARADGVSVSDYVRRLVAADEVRCIAREAREVSRR